MQRYQCHKVVEAAKIATVKFAYNDVPAQLTLEDSEVVTVDDRLMRAMLQGERLPSGAPDLGYYIRYEDGYESWSPSKAFEDGYSLIPPPGGDLPDDFEVN